MFMIITGFDLFFLIYYWSIYSDYGLMTTFMTVCYVLIALYDIVALFFTYKAYGVLKREFMN